MPVTQFKQGWMREAVELAETGISWRKVAKRIGVPRSTVSDNLRKYYKELRECLKEVEENNPVQGVPKVLVFDIETSQMFLGGFQLFNQNFSLDQIEQDWKLISFSAKWMGEDEVFYYDISDMSEREVLVELWNLLDQADFVLGHNVARFDVKRVKARMLINGIKPFSPVRTLDTLQYAKQYFGFTSNRLAYLTHTLCKRFKKSSHEKFHGYSLWSEFIKGNKEAIDEMREYAILDTQSVEELFLIMLPWINNLPNFNLYLTEVDTESWEWDGKYVYTNLGKYKQYRCLNTGRYMRGRVNLLSKEERAKLLGNINY